MPTYVIGHKNPDTDAICAAIGYADFLRRTGMPEAEAACCGEVSARTAFALDRAKLPYPKLILDVRPTAGQVCRRDVTAARTDDSFQAAFDLMRTHDLRNLPVLDGEGRPKGMLSLFKLVDLLLPKSGPSAVPEATRLIESSLDRIGRVLSAEFQHRVDTEKEEELMLVVAALNDDDFAVRLTQYASKKIIVVLGNRPHVQKSAIAAGARAIVVTSGNRLPDDLLQEAKKKGVTVLASPSDTATTTLLIRCAKAISHATSPEFDSFPETATIEAVRKAVEHSHNSLFLVLDGAGKLAGVLSKSDLLDPPRTRLVLVDHNEWNQAVDGAQEAEIVEVLDHHRLGGGLATRHPIRFINDTVGSTSTLVARCFRQAGLVPEPAIALALASGMISDTLYLTSPTTTDADRDLLAWLEKAARTDLRKFADEFFAAGSVLINTPPEQAIRTDCKEYVESGWKIAVAQIEEQGMDNFWKKRDALAATLKEILKKDKLDFVCLLVTDIGTHNSVMLAEGAAPILKAIDYPQREEGLYNLDGVVSRKKQLLPHLIHILEKARAAA